MLSAAACMPCAAGSPMYLKIRHDATTGFATRGKTRAARTRAHAKSLLPSPSDSLTDSWSIRRRCRPSLTAIQPSPRALPRNRRGNSRVCQVGNVQPRLGRRTSDESRNKRRHASTVRANFRPHSPQALVQSRGLSTPATKAHELQSYVRIRHAQPRRDRADLRTMKPYAKPACFPRFIGSNAAQARRGRRSARARW